MNQSSSLLPGMARRCLTRCVLVALLAVLAFGGVLSLPAGSVEAQGPGVLVYGLVSSCSCDPSTAPSTLVRFNSTTPNHVTTVGPITGIAPDDMLATMAFRPSNGRLYGFTYNGALYTIQTSNGAASRVGSQFWPVSDIPSMSFDPVTDQIRIISVAAENFRLDPDTGNQIAVDTNLTGCGSPLGLANTNAFPGATSTTVYSIDVCDGVLVRIGGLGGVPSPSTGQVFEVGPLNLPFDSNEPAVIFDVSIAISGGSQPAALLSAVTYQSILDNNARLFTVDLNSGQATLVGPILAGDNLVGPIAVAPSGVIRVAQSAISVNETSGVANVEIQRTGGAFSTVTVNYATANGTAIAGVDYTAVSGTLTFLEGETSKTVAVPILQTPSATASKTFALNLTNPSANVQLSAARSTTVTIIEDAPSTQLRLSAAQYSVHETAGSISISVQRLGPSAGTVGVSYATSDGTGQAGLDYVATNGQLSFGNGETERQVVVPLLINPAATGTRTFNLTLSAPTGGAVLGTPAAAVVTIIDDALVTPEIQFTTPAVSVTEFEASVSLHVWRLGNLGLPSGVNYATVNGTAVAGVDYVARSGTLTFAPGAADSIVTFTILQTPGGQGNKSFTVVLSSPTGATLGPITTATVTILDPGSPPHIQFAVRALSVDEAAGSLIVTVDRVGNTATAVGVSYSTRNGTAVAGVDYTATSGSLQFQPGFATGTISIPIIDRVGAQGIRLFQVDLSNATGGAVLGSPSTLAITILDSGYPATIQFAIAQITVRETDRRVSLRVTRQGDISGTSTIGYATVAGTATAGVDFTPVSGTLTFGPGETDKIIVVAIRNDIEGTSVTFGLILTSPTGAVIGPQRTVVVTILPQRVTAPLVFKGQRGLPHIAAQSKPGVPVQRPR